MPIRGGINLADLPFRAFLPLFLALLALVCVPLTLTALPPLVDRKMKQFIKQVQEIGGMFLSHVFIASRCVAGALPR